MGGGIAVLSTPSPEYQPAKILIVEADESYREALDAGLRKEGYDIELAADGLDGLRRYTDNPPDLVILNAVLPVMAGSEVCRRMCAQGHIPVIMVSALDSEVDVVLGLEIGAADYVTKPYRLREMIARIQAVLRRASSTPLFEAPGRSAANGSEVVVAGPVRLDLARHEVLSFGQLVDLSRREFDLLAFLLCPPGQVRSREEIINLLWSGRDLADTRTLDTHVRRLRVKLEIDPGNPQFLVTVRGVGFRFDADGRGER
jgi:two-component system response regulator RegX3